MKSILTTKKGMIMKVLFVFLLLFCVQVFAGPYQVNVYSTKVVTVGPTTTLESPANLGRQYLLIQNNGTVNVAVSFASPTAPGILIPPGGNYEPIKAEMDAIYMTAGTSGQSVTILEGQ